MGVNGAYDLQRLTAAGVVWTHHEGKIETDGPWLILHSPAADALELLCPAHTVTELVPCRGETGGCRGGR